MLFLIANLVTTSKALVTRSDALVSNGFLLLVQRQGKWYSLKWYQCIKQVVFDLIHTLAVKFSGTNCGILQISSDIRAIW